MTTRFRNLFHRVIARAEDSLDNAVHRSLYEPLDDDNDSIRLIELLPGQFDDKLSCSIRTTRITEHFHYEALSYAWGDAGVTERVICDGYHVRITVNLADALRHLRYPDKARILYADAICIDQRNLDERGRQVRLMADIFRNAQSVLIWLGPDESSLAELAFEHIARYAEYCKPQLKGSGNWGGLKFEDWGSPPPDHRIINAISNVLGRSWFGRVWVLQEAAVARQASLICGFSTMDLRELAIFAYAIERRSTSITRDRFNMNRIYGNLANVWLTYDNEGTWLDGLELGYLTLPDYEVTHKISFILREVSRRHVSDRRDMVYAMLGHPALQWQGQHEALVQPNYNIGFEDLCLNLTIACIEKNNDWSVLSLVHHRDVSPVHPTWVPTLNNFPGSFFLRQSNASGRLDSQVAIRESRLQCLGIALAPIACPAEAFPHYSDIGNVAGVTTFIKVLTTLLGCDIVVRSLSEGSGTAIALVHVLDSRPIIPGTPQSAVEEVLRRDVKVMAECLMSRHPDYELIDGHIINTAQLGDEHAEDEAKPSPPPINGFNFTERNDKFSQMFATCTDRRVFSTHLGFWGVGPSFLQDGDICCVIYGSDAPFILRPTSGVEGAFEFVGQCFISDLQPGEVEYLLERGEVQEQMFTIY